MLRLLMSVLLVLTLAPCALAECTAADKSALEAFDRAWGDSSRAGDRAALQQIYASDYMNMAPGNTQTKTEAIDTALADAERERKNANPASVTHDHYIINCSPVAATVTHRNVTTEMHDGKEHISYGRSVHVLEKRGGKWQVVSNAGHPLSDAATLTYMEQDWADADLKRDVTWFERNFARDYTGISSRNGKLMRKADEMEDLRTRKDSVESVQLMDMSTRMEGDTGIVTGVYHVTGRDEQGKAMDRRIRFSDVFVRRDGRWQVLSSQGTRIQD